MHAFWELSRNNLRGGEMLFKEAGGSTFCSSKLHKFTKNSSYLQRLQSLRNHFQIISFQNILKFTVLHIKSTLKLEKKINFKS